MIFESAPWKALLARDAELVGRWAVKAPTDRRTFLIERKLFLSAYAIRKLAEDHKLSTATLSASVAVRLARPLKPGFSGVLHWIDRYFDLANPVRHTLNWRRVLNMMIHSSTFAEAVDDEGRVTGFLVTSDKEVGRGLIQVELNDFLKLMRAVSDDYPSVVRQTRDSKDERWITWAGHDPGPSAPRKG